MLRGMWKWDGERGGEKGMRRGVRNGATETDGEGEFRRVGDFECCLSVGWPIGRSVRQSGLPTSLSVCICLSWDWSSNNRQFNHKEGEGAEGERK